MEGRQDPARRRVVAWGRSVLASALVAGLAERTEFDVVQVEATLPAVLTEVRRRRTHAVVCDLTSVPASDVLALLAAQAHLRVVIVDPNADRGLALSGRRPLMRTLDDLVSALLEGAVHAGDPVPTSSP